MDTFGKNREHMIIIVEMYLLSLNNETFAKLNFDLEHVYMD